MKNPPFVVTIIVAAIVLVSCAKSGHDQFIAANTRLMEIYRAGDAQAAEKALLDYRHTIIASKGFAATVDIDFELNLIDARLFSLNLFLGRNSNATYWFNSSVTNLSNYRRKKGWPVKPSTTNSLEEVVQKLDDKIDVEWRTNRVSLGNIR